MRGLLGTLVPNVVGNRASCKMLTQLGDMIQEGIDSLTWTGGSAGDIFFGYESGNQVGDRIPDFQLVEICVGDGDFLEFGLL